MRDRQRPIFENWGTAAVDRTWYCEEFEGRPDTRNTPVGWVAGQLRDSGQGRLNEPFGPCVKFSPRMMETDRQADALVDQGLVERWQAGDERAASAIVERHAPALKRFAVSLGVREEVDELVQDTFVRAFGALDSFRSESSLRTWLFTIERRLVLDRRRTETRRRNEVEVNDSDAVTGYDALDTIVADEVRTRVTNALEKLSRMQREVFVLRVQEGRSYKEIADILGSSEGAARVHYHNAMRAVKEFLDD